ncbi:nuclear transport factor 2 family protein [Sphingobacterium sp. SGG-5]|nr:nuclear transport factor 2 family protein [Sphingobacterium sp. SGG-5]
MSTKKVVMSMIILAIAFGNQETKAQHTEQISVEKAVDKLTNAMLTANRNALSDLASDKLSYGHSSGKVENKKEFVETIASGASVFEQLQIENQSIDIDHNTAIVRHTLTGRTNDPGKGPAALKIGIVLVWTKADGSWKLLARQAFKLP